MTNPAQKAETGTAGFTAGPWKVNAANPNSGYRRVFMPDDLVQIETAGPPGSMVACLFRRNFPGDMDAANARLIAAAPDLYAALNECRLWLEDNQPMPTARMWELAAKVRAALAKATGG